MAAGIALFGQIIAAIIPFWLGPSDLSDFSINIDRVYYEIGSDGNNFSLHNIQPIESLPGSGFKDVFVLNNTVIIPSTITVKNLQRIKSYPHTVFLRVVNPPDGFSFAIPKPEGKPKFETQMNISIPFSNFGVIKIGNYPITIQGIGGDGRVRNCTCYISIVGKMLDSHLTVYNQTNEYSILLSDVGNITLSENALSVNKDIGGGIVLRGVYDVNITNNNISSSSNGSGITFERIYKNITIYNFSSLNKSPHTVFTFIKNSSNFSKIPMKNFSSNRWLSV